VGVGGLLLGGGISFLSAQEGLAADVSHFLSTKPYLELIKQEHHWLGDCHGQWEHCQRRRSNTPRPSPSHAWFRKSIRHRHSIQSQGPSHGRCMGRLLCLRRNARRQALLRPARLCRSRCRRSQSRNHLLRPRLSREHKNKTHILLLRQPHTPHLRSFCRLLQNPRISMLTQNAEVF
jgi:hypothetical protein